MDPGAASRTAVLVCQGRAVAHGRIAAGRFDDPTAMALLREPERAPVELVRAGVPPRAWRERVDYERVRGVGEVMVPRTVRIDDAVRERLAPQLVILGAGLDGRAWRLPELADTEVFEVDHPATQHDKQDRVGGLEPRCRSLRYVPVDFTRDALGVALAEAGHREGVATTWIWEGVVPYLTPVEVEATVRVVGERSAPGSRLVVNYQAPSWKAVVGRVVARAMAVVAHRVDPFEHEPRRSAWKPDAMSSLLVGHGLRVTEDEDLLTLARRLPMTVENQRSAATGRVAVAERSMVGGS